MDNFIITIARGFGSGGKSIARELGNRMGIPCYEDEILRMASDASGINQALFQERNEKLRGGLFAKALKKIPATQVLSPSDKDFVSDVNLFNYQAEIIRSLAVGESCIIVGKCADYVLEGYERIIRVYVDAPRDACIESIVKKMGVTEDEANRLIVKTDKYRADYYKYYTGRDWTNPTNYDIFINSKRVGRENCAELIEMYAKFKLGI
jgi:cytidylate kinase